MSLDLSGAQQLEGTIGEFGDAISKLHYELYNMDL
jgi:hypothetical protein